MTMRAEDVIATLGLEPHPEEGGYYRETYRSRASFAPGVPFDGDRSVGTAIYFLLTPSTFSEMHRLPGDEVFHFYLGDPVDMLLLHPDGLVETPTLTSDLSEGRPQVVVPGGVWQGSRLREGGSFALLGTTMGPGFEFPDYESGTTALAESYPEHADTITSLLRKVGAS
ncbi:MAG: cupin domain-containing protein [Longimicrobiales bacterium]|nr:cupin domain-containing protein [Longimicrobiales bacterium]